MATDFTKVPLEILVDLINSTNGCALTTADISFSPPTALISGSRNTGLTITAKPNSSYTGTRNVTYDRVNMAAIPGLRSTEFNLNGALTMKDLVPQINLAYRLNLQAEDYYDDFLPDLNDPTLTSYNFVLRAKPGSYIYRGMLVLTAAGDKITISDYLTQNLLSGFIPPTAEDLLQGDRLLNGFYFPGQSGRADVFNGSAITP